MHEDDRCCAFAYRFPEYLSWMRDGFVEGSDADERVLDKSLPRIEQKDVCLFLVGRGCLVSDVVCNGVRAVNQFTFLQFQLQQPSCQRERGCESDRLRLANA